MITCPVCEHTQASGVECENCGKQLVAARTQDLPSERMPDLEVTQIVNPKLRVQAEVMPDLELTKMRSGPDLPAQQVPELERTAMPAVANVAAERVADLELGRVEDSDPRTAAPVGAVTCRYCRNVQASGAICDRCGMRLPRAAVPPAPAATATGPAGWGPDDEWTRCRDCGSRAKHGTRCGNCGHLIDPPTE